MTRKYTKKIKKNGISLSLKLGNEVITSEGTDAFEALKKLKKPTKIFNKGLLTVSNGTDSRVVGLQVVAVKRLFYPMAQRILAKQLSFGLK